MDNIVVKIIFLIAAAALSLGLYAYVSNMSDKSETTMEITGEKLDSMNIALSESDYTKYDGASVRGADVISVVKYTEQMQDQVVITVVTNKSTRNYVWKDETFKEASEYNIRDAYDKSSDGYIPSGKHFTGEVIRDENGTLTNLTFTIND